MKLRIFAGSIFVTILCMGLAGYWGAHHPMGITVALYTTLVLAIMEVSLSFDNAVINATKLKTLSPAWQILLDYWYFSRSVWYAILLPNRNRS